MSVHAIQVRLDCDRTVLQHLWRTHRVFNERLPSFISLLMRMRRGECGDTQEKRALYQQIGTFITSYSAQNADYLLNSVSIRNWKPGSAQKYKIKETNPEGKVEEIGADVWAEQAARLSAKGELLFDKEKMTGDLPGAIRQMLSRESVAIISGHEELVKRWEKDHEEWLLQKKAWELKPEHQHYMALRPRFEAFEQSVGGKIGKRRGRWHLYLNWLRENPDLAAWRGGLAVVHGLPTEAQARIQKAKPWKQRSVEAEEFWRVNPELAALDKLHGYYEREFVRRRKNKKGNKILTGFKRRPTFTMPDPVAHPRWFVFNAPQTNPPGYRNLKLPTTKNGKGSIELCLLIGEKAEAEYPSKWVSLIFNGDRRLAAFSNKKVSKLVTKGKNKGQTTERDAFEFYDAHLQRKRPAEISGAKLILKDLLFNEDGSLKSAQPYLVFTCTIKDEPLTENAKRIEWSETGDITKSGKARKKKKLPEGLVVCSVDLGVRHLGFATLAVYENGTPRILRARSLRIGHEEDKGRHPGRWSPGPDLGHIADHKRCIRRLRRLRGKPIKGEESHVELQDHITHMGEDRFKQGARAIINFALNTDKAANRNSGAPFPRADVLLLESLEGLIPDAERERGINRALIRWNRGQLVNAIREMAKDAGLKIFEVSPVGTSQVCSRCGHLGRRYSISRNDETGKPDIRFGWVEKLFACSNPNCPGKGNQSELGYCANADFNASVNLHRRFLLDDAAVLGFFSWKTQSETLRKAEIDRLDARLLNPLRRMHGLANEDDSSPF